MNEEKLSNRLQKVADFVPNGSIVADIGSDHGYLPAYLVLQNKIVGAIAGEVVVGPYQSARQKIESLGLTEQVSVRLGDGLQILQPNDQVNVVTICGMGGKLIADILATGRKGKYITGRERLILQPNMAEPIVRRWLQDNHYQIIAEQLLVEEEKFYEIIVAEYHPEERSLYSEEAIFFGPHLMAEKSPIFIQKWQAELSKYYYVLAQLQRAKQISTEKVRETQQKINWIEEVL